MREESTNRDKPFRSRPTYLLFVKQFALCVRNLEEVIEHNLSAMFCSLELRSGIVVPLECSIDNLGAHVDHVGHNWLVLRAVPSNVSWLSVSVSVGGSVVLMVHRSLSGSPLSVSIGNGRVLGKNTSDCPVEQIWVVHKRLGVERMVVENNRTVVTETTANTSDDEIADPAISEPAADIEVLNRELANDSQTKKYANLSASGIVSPVKVGLVSRTSDDGQISSWEPAL